MSAVIGAGESESVPVAGNFMLYLGEGSNGGRTATNDASSAWFLHT